MKTFPGTDGNITGRTVPRSDSGPRLWADPRAPVSAPQGRASPPDVLSPLLESSSCSLNGLLWQLCWQRRIQLLCSTAASAKLLLPRATDQLLKAAVLCGAARCWAVPRCCLLSLTLGAGMPHSSESKLLTWVIPNICWMLSQSALKASKPRSGLRGVPVEMGGWF